MSRRVMGLAAVSLVAAASFAGLSAGQEPASPGAVAMSPGKGLSLDIGAKHAVGYFEPRNAVCALTILVAQQTDGEISQDSPGTRFSVQVAPGSRAQIDAADGKSAEFVCGAAGTKMNARVFDRPAWSAKS